MLGKFLDYPADEIWWWHRGPPGIVVVLAGRMDGLAFLQKWRGKWDFNSDIETTHSTFTYLFRELLRSRYSSQTPRKPRDRNLEVLRYHFHLTNRRWRVLYRGDDTNNWFS